MNLKEDLGKRPSRELGGSRGSDSYDYQKDWALSLILRLHLADNNYLIIFEQHEDFIVLDDDSNPACIDFYQIKSNDNGRGWSLNDLLKTGKESKNSILGKLYQNILNFPNANALILASNAKFKIKLVDQSLSSKEFGSIKFDQISEDLKTKIIEDLSKELDTDLSQYNIKKIGLFIRDLGLEDHRQAVLGRIVDFFEEISSFCKLDYKSFYQSLFDEIKVKTDYTRRTADYEELSQRKGITRYKVQALIDKAVKSEELESVWASIQMILIAEGRLNIQEIMQLRSAWRKSLLSKYEYNNIATINMAKTIKEIVSTAAMEWTSLSEIVEHAFEVFKATHTDDASIFSPWLIKAHILREWHELS